MDQSRESQKKISDMSQLAGIRNMEFKSGKAKGASVFEVYNEAGLCFSVLPDQCLDIYDFRFKGKNIGYPAKNGLHSSAFLNTVDNEFVYNWRAGLLYTCGLANVGYACTDNGLYRTEHGRIGMMPAENVCARSEWKDGKYILSIEGEMTESIVVGPNMRLCRRIETELDSKEIRIIDRIENLQPNDEEFMFTYHINFGYPIVDERTRLVKGKGDLKPRTPHAATGIDEWNKSSAPFDEYEEQCFFHENTPDKDGFAYMGMINDDLDLGVCVKYSYDTLPIALEWKSMLAHDYTIAIQPGNTYLMGRDKERQNGTLPVLKGYETKNYNVSICVLEGPEIEEFEKTLSNL